MALDPFSLLNTVTETQRRGVEDLRPQVDLSATGIRLTDISASVMGESAPVASTGTDVRELPQSPADPRWRYRIPPPDCMKCNHPHIPGRGYDHEYHDGSPKETTPPMIEQVNGITGSGPPNPLSPNGGVGRRVAIYDSRTGYIIKVEEAPDWDDVFKAKLTKDNVAALLPILKALRVKVKNNSEDEFDDDELAEDRPQPAPRVGAGFTREGFEAACRELGIDPEKVRATGITGDVGPDPDGLADAAGHPEGDGAEDQG